MTTATKLHIDLLTQKATALLVGAGISINSGIPSVYPFLEYFFQKLGIKNEDIQIYLDSGFPFEATMENIQARVDESIIPLLKVFDVNNPNYNHKMIASLVKRGLLKIILTTNFDQNIELALKAENLIEGTDFIVLKEFDDFEIEKHQGKVFVLKLHGSIEQDDSIITTITRVAGRSNISLMGNVIRKLFSSPYFDNLLTWGYSFSDHFDINPALQQIPKSRINLFILQHINLGAPQRIEDANTNSRFKKFAHAQFVLCNLDEVVSELSAHLEITIGKPITMNNWKEIVDEWFDAKVNGSEFRNKYSLITFLFSEAGQHKIAISYAKEGLSKLNGKDLVLKADLLSQIGKSLMADPNDRKAKEAIPYFIQAVEISRYLNRGGDYVVHISNLGSCYNDLGDLANAEKCFMANLRFHEPHILSKNPMQRRYHFREFYGTKINLGILKRKQGRLQESLQLLKTVQHELHEKGEFELSELAASALGSIYSELNDYAKELVQCEIAYEMAKSYGKPDRIKSTFVLLYQILLVVKGENEARRFRDAEFKDVARLTGLTNSEFVKIVTRRTLR